MRIIRIQFEKATALEFKRICTEVCMIDEEVHSYDLIVDPHKGTVRLEVISKSAEIPCVFFSNQIATPKQHEVQD